MNDKIVRITISHEPGATLCDTALHAIISDKEICFSIKMTVVMATGILQGDLSDIEDTLFIAKSKAQERASNDR